MDIIDEIRQWSLAHPTSMNVIKYVILVLLSLLVISLVRRWLKRRIPDTTIRYRAQKLVEILGYVFLIILTISYFSGHVTDLTLAIGLFSAGVALTLQELILSIAGSLYIFMVKVYKPGDRVEINGIKGDIIDIDSVYTTLMEIGEWVSSDNYSGRIVKLSNAFVFKGAIYNYSQDFPFIWDELELPVRYGSDLDLVREIIIRVAQEGLADFTRDSKAKWADVVNKYYIEDAQIDPTLAMTLTDNWVQFNLRYIVDFKKRRLTKHQLFQAIEQEVAKTDDKVQLASATIEVIRIPEVKINAQTKAKKTDETL